MALQSLAKQGFQVEFLSHARAILEADFPSVLAEVETALGALKIPIEEIIGSGGGETQGTQRLRRALEAAGWKKASFEIRKTIKEALQKGIDEALGL
jgi:hypothetical protein